MSKAPIPIDLEPIAAIDIGTNSIHLVIAKVDQSGHLMRLDTDKVTQRLGQMITPDGYIMEAGIRETLETLKHMKEIYKAYTSHVRAVATHATRSARNHMELIKAASRVTGIRIEVIDGIEEGRLVYLGIQQGLPLHDKRVICVDIGGGSTELVAAGNDDIYEITSLKLGAVTATKNHFNNKPATQVAIDDLIQHIDGHVAPLRNQYLRHKPDIFIATSGTAKALAQVHAALNGRPLIDANGYVIPSEDLAILVRNLQKLSSPKKIADELNVDTKRSEILLAGATILAEITQQFEVKEWTICTYGLREGLVIDTFRRTYGFAEAPASPDIRWRSVMQFAQRYGTDLNHARQVETIAMQIFDQLYVQSFQSVSEEIIEQDRVLLRAAALLHEAGKYINDTGYHKHSRYLIANGHLLGFTQDERHTIANVVRFHRKSIPTRTHLDCNSLSFLELDKLRFLSSILRMAVALDRSRQSRVNAVRVEKSRGEIRLSLSPREGEPLFVELRSLTREDSTIERCLGLALKVEVVL